MTVTTGLTNVVNADHFWPDKFEFKHFNVSPLKNARLEKVAQVLAKGKRGLLVMEPLRRPVGSVAV